MARKTHKKQADSDFYDENERKQSIEWDAWKAALKNTRKWKILILIFIFTGFISPILAVNANNNVIDIGRTLGTLYKESQGEKPGRQAALAAVNAWLTSDNPPFASGVANIWWDDAEKVEESTDSSTNTTTAYWTHHLSFTDLSDGSTRDVTQLVSVTNGVAKAVGQPTILPKAVNSSSAQDAFTPTGYNRLDQSDSLNNVASAWAKAYVGKDSSALTVLVADPNSNNAYQPAALGTFKGATVNWIVECDKDGKPTPKDQQNENPEYGAASITIAFQPYPKQSNDTNSTKQDTVQSSVSSRMNITVLIKNPTQGSAKIVDWGADGLISTLKPYANAIDKQLISANTSADEGDTTGDTSTSTPSTDSAQADDKTSMTEPDSQTNSNK